MLLKSFALVIGILLLSGCGMMGSKSESQSSGDDTLVDTSVENSLNSHPPIPQEISMGLPNPVSATCTNYYDIRNRIADIEQTINLLKNQRVDINLLMTEYITKDNSIYNYQLTLREEDSHTTYLWSDDQNHTFTHYQSDDFNLSMQYQADSFMHIHATHLTQTVSLTLLQNDTNSFTVSINAINESNDNFSLHTTVTTHCQNQQVPLELTDNHLSKGEYLLLPPNTYHEGLSAAAMFQSAMGNILVTEQSSQGMLYDPSYREQTDLFETIQIIAPNRFQKWER